MLSLSLFSSSIGLSVSSNGISCFSSIFSIVSSVAGTISSSSIIIISVPSSFNFEMRIPPFSYKNYSDKSYFCYIIFLFILILSFMFIICIANH